MPDKFNWGSLNPNGNLAVFSLTIDKAGKKMSGSGVNTDVTGRRSLYDAHS